MNISRKVAEEKNEKKTNRIEKNSKKNPIRKITSNSSSTTDRI